MANGSADSKDMTWSKLWKIVKTSKVWHAAVHRVTKLEMT